MTDYTATKAALAGYTRGAARDLGPRGITVNIVQAGLVDTEMNPADTEFAARPPPPPSAATPGRRRSPPASPSWRAPTRHTSPAPPSTSTAGTAHEHIAALPRARSRSRPTVSRSSPNTRLPRPWWRAWWRCQLGQACRATSTT
jgi:NAD(P)-dependent dehydrogenase (short-subunit alcohol dehydrogenase family)